MTSVLALLLSAAVQAEEPQVELHPHFALGLGTGVAYGTAGVHAELIFTHFAPYLGAGFDLFSAEAFCFAGGARLFLGDGEGLMLSLNFAVSSGGQTGSVNSREGDYIDDRFAGASIGWRFRARSGLFAELAFGGAALHSGYHGHSYSPSAGNPCGTAGQDYACGKDQFFPDINLAVGFVF